MSSEDTCTSFYTPRPVKQAEEDHLSSTKDKVIKLKPSNPARPTVKVITEDDPKGKLLEYIVYQGVRHYWKVVEAPTVIHHSK